MITLMFYKDYKGDWFVDLPSWKGDKEELQMVSGADTLLDIISNNNFNSENFLKINIFQNEKHFKNSNKEFYALIRDNKETESGSYYKVKHSSNLIKFDIWLCNVTKFVFGYFPDVLYFTF